MKSPLPTRPRHKAKGLWARMAPSRPSGAADVEILAEAGSRARWAFAGLTTALVLLTLRAGWVMGVPDERLEARGREQFRFAVEMRGRRGSIVDRNGRVLASTVNLPSLYANPSKLAPELLEARLAGIAALTGRSDAWI